MDRQYVFNDYRHIRAMQSLLLLLPEGYTSFPLIWEAGDTRIFYLFEEKCGPTQLEMLIDGLESSIGRLEKVVAKAGDVVSEIPPQKRFFFNNNLRYQAHYLLRLSKSLYHMAKTMEARPRSDYHDKQEVFISHMEAALEHFTAARALLDKTETGPFEGWYNTYDKRYPFEELTRSIEEVKTYFINHRF